MSFEWIKCSKKLSPRDTEILVCSYDKRCKGSSPIVISAFRVKDDYYYSTVTGKRINSVTHWMLYPKPPTDFEKK